MADLGLGGFRTINSFVENKLRVFGESGKTFETMFSLMFREEGNIMYEKTEGYRIVSTTYGEARREIERLTGNVSGTFAPLPGGSVVGIYMENSLEWIETFWAVIRAGFRPLLLNLRLPDALLLEAVAASGCEAVICGPGLEGKRGFPVRTVTFGEIAGAEPGAADAEVPYGKEILVMSSGTSNHVKVCAYTAEEFYYQIAGSFDIIKKCPVVKKHYESRMKLLTFLPFYHVFGLIAVYIWFAFFSRTFVHLPDMAPDTIIGTIKRHKVTHIFAVPLFWEKVRSEALKTIKGMGDDTYTKFGHAMGIASSLPGPASRLFSRMAFREVREKLFGESIVFMIAGGSAISPDVLGFFNGIGYRLANGYGMTEVGITSLELSADRKYLDAGYVGAPMAHAEYKIDENGELLVRGEVISKYIIEDGVRRDRHDGEWFATHDLAEEKNGHYRILGRRDDLIVSRGGENLNPNTLEPLLAPKGAAGVCLTGVRGTDGGTEPWLIVSVGRYLTAETLEKMREDAERKIEEAGLTGEIRNVVFTTDALLKPEEIKLNRMRLAREAGQGLLTPAGMAETETGGGDTDPLADEICRIFESVTDCRARGKEAAPGSDFFTDLGGTSLDYLSLISEVRDRYGVPVPAEDGHTLKTARDVASFVRKAQNDI